MTLCFFEAGKLTLMLMFPLRMGDNDEKRWVLLASYFLATCFVVAIPCQLGNELLVLKLMLVGEPLPDPN